MKVDNKDYKSSQFIQPIFCLMFTIARTIFLLILISSTLCSSLLQFKDCNFTDFRFQSQYNLGQQDELNNTFNAIDGKFTVSDLVYPVNSYTNYSFKEIKTGLRYDDSRQRADIMGRDTIVIVGGYVQVSVQMKWQRRDFLQRGGSLQARCRSDQILFAKNLTIDRGFLVYQVSDYYNISFTAQDCKLIRYEPANISDLDMGYIRQLLNHRDDNKSTVKDILALEINNRYLTELKNSLYNQRHRLDQKFFYNWTHQTKAKTINIEYQVLPTGVDLEKEGLSFTFVTQIKDYDNWQCGTAIPHDNLPIAQYGGIQQFLSLSVFKNTLKYGIQLGALDTILNNADWKSSMFQFFAGDLYEVMPYVGQMYRARDEITGMCKALTENLVVTPSMQINQLGVRTEHMCDLFIRGTTKIISMKIDLYTQIEAKFQQQSQVNFYVKSFTHNLSYFEQPLFKIANYNFANALVLSTLKKIINMKTFGSGWATFKMDLPQMKSMPAGYALFFDSSHVGVSDL